MKNACHPERGSAAVYILLGIALLVMFTMVVSKGFRFGGSSMSDDTMAISAQEVIDYANGISAAVSKLRVRGCTETQISFETTLYPTANPLAPTNDSCDVFSESGGKVLPRAADELPGGGEIIFSGESDLLGIGSNGCGDSTCSDLYMVIILEGSTGVSICGKINDILGHDSLDPTPSTTYLAATTPFNGTYGTDVTVNADFTGMTSACYNNSGDTNQNIFFQVLVAR